MKEAAQLARERSRSPAIALPTTDVAMGSQSAIKFELNWLKFIKDAEDEYNLRLCRVSVESCSLKFGDNEHRPFSLLSTFRININCTNRRILYRMKRLSL